MFSTYLDMNNVYQRNHIYPYNYTDSIYILDKNLRSFKTNSLKLPTRLSNEKPYKQ